MKTIRKIAIGIIIAALALPVISCGNSTADSTPAGTVAAVGTARGESSVSETTAAETAAVDWSASGVTAADYGGYAFTIAAQKGADYAWWKLDVDAENGEPLNDAIFERNKKIEEVFNIDISTVEASDASTSVKKTVNAGDDTYSLAFGTLANLFNIGPEGYLYNLYTLPHVDLTKSWWDSSITNGLTIAKKLYIQGGDITPIVNVRTFALVFNKDLCTKLGYSSPYDKVLDGTWTLDVFADYAKGVNADLNGDGVMDYDDQWGYFSQNGNSLMAYFAAGGTITSRDGNSNPVISFNTQHNIDVAVKALEITIDPDVTLMADKYVANNGNSWQAASAWFASGHSLLRSSVFEPVPRDYRSMETDFGVLPYPKYDEAQPTYLSLTEMTSAFALAVPANVSDADRTGAILEAMAAQSAGTVKPAFYDVCLDGKYVRDEESQKTIDLIFDNKVFDIGNLLGLGGFTGKLTALEKAKQTDVASAFATISDKAQASLDKFMTTMSEQQ